MTAAANLDRSELEGRQVPAEIVDLRIRTRERSMQVRRVALERVRFHPDNIRRDLGDITGLAASVRAHGILQPLVAENCGAFLQLLMGHRRLAAAHAAKLRTVPVVVVRAHQLDEALLLMLAENTRRESLTGPDRAAALRKLVEDHDYTRAELAEHLGVSAATVSNWMGETIPRPAPARPRVPRIAPTRLHGLCREWERGTQAGLSGPEVTELLGQLRELLGGWAPNQPTEAGPDVDGATEQASAGERTGAGQTDTGAGPS
jgi:ParB family chromosome partitioning protein